MTRIENEKQYQAVMSRIEELLLVVDDNTPTDDRNAVKLVLLSNLAADYDELHIPIAAVVINLINTWQKICKYS